MGIGGRAAVFALTALYVGPLAAQYLTVYSSGSVAINETRQLTAYVPLSPNTVTWSVNGVTGGNTTYGTVSPAGLYKAPAVVPANNVVVVAATSTAYPTQSASVNLTVTQPPVQLWSTSPTSVPVGSFTISLNGYNFAANSTVMFGGTPLSTTFVSATSLKASGSAAASQAGTKVPVTVVNSGLGGTTSSAVQLSVTAAPAVSVTVSPSTATVPATTTRQFSATVSGASNTAVTWSATAGTISSSGLYTAPASVPSPATITVRATNVANPAVSGAATVTISAAPAVSVTVAPASADVTVGTTRQFSATVTGASDPSVNWSVNGMVGGSSTVGTISSTGLYTAPNTVPSPALVTITATSAVSPGSSASAAVTVRPPAQVTVTLSPTSATVAVNATQQFTANVPVTWSATAGTITSAGLFTAPAAIPNPATVTITATSTTSPASIATASVTVVAAPVTVTVSPATVTVAPSGAQQFTANVPVTWSATAGSISASGLFTAPATIPNPATVTIRATSTANTASFGTAVATIAGAPNPGTGQGTPTLSAARFLEQAAFGPTPAELAHVQQVGFDAWLTEQFAMPETPIVNPGAMASGTVQQQYLNRLSAAPDQLRQKVAYALSQIIVISLNKNLYPDQVVPYLQILSANAFGNYRTLLGQITVSSQMGNYLDLARSTKAGNGAAPNENYPREVMQLFTIGLYQLNLDGSQQLDSNGKPVPTYDQSTIQQVAKALTGWVYINNAWQDFSGPMQPLESNHDTTAKSFLGCNLPANQSTVQDTNATMDCLFNHPNVGPFVATRLIRALVTSNPTPAYIARIAAVFNNNGQGVRGDLKAVVRAILLDAEARNDAATPTSGRLKDPMYQIVSFVRAMNGSIAATNGLPWQFSRLAQAPISPPSVFSFYSPLYRVPKSPLFGPEFQIYTPTESVLRGNFLWQIISNPGAEFSVDFTPFSGVAGNLTQLIDAVDQKFLYGRMPQAMRQSLAIAITAQQDNTSRAQIAVYLTALSGLYAVQY